MSPLPAVFFLFVDGLGLGRPDPAVNPLVGGGLPWLTAIAGRSLAAGPWMPGISYRAELPGGLRPAALVACDAGLGVEGLPQSATGQAALFTGVNAAALVGRHVNAYPTGRLKDLIDSRSLFRRAAEAGRRVTFANAFSPEYFELVATRRLRHSASTLAVLAAGLVLRDLEQLRAGQAVYQDITNRALIARGHQVPLVEPAQAGRNAAAVAGGHDLTVFEYFQTDLAGHRADPAAARRVLEVLDGFLGGLLEGLDSSRHLLALAADHGNIEDLAVATHTMNPVPALFLGEGAEAAAAGVSSITDLAPAILGHLGVPA
ncbi:MAG: metalloenzyme [bacterium]|nr:metalloenzyme [bacterium]